MIPFLFKPYRAAQGSLRCEQGRAEASWRFRRHLRSLLAAVNEHRAVGADLGITTEAGETGLQLKEFKYRYLAGFHPQGQ